MVSSRRSSEKGNEFEWLIAKRLSAWMHPEGDTKELIRSVQSGGWVGRSVPQIGDLAPNGEYGAQFRSIFSVECKHWKVINWWHVFSAPRSELILFWKKTCDEADDNDLIPLYIIKQNSMPIVVCFPMGLYSSAVDMLVVRHLNMAVVPLALFLLEKPEWYYDNWHPVGRG